MRGIPTQRPGTRSFDVFVDLRLNKRLSKQSWGWWFETLSHPLWRHRNDVMMSSWHSVYTAYHKLWDTPPCHVSRSDLKWYLKSSTPVIAMIEIINQTLTLPVYVLENFFLSELEHKNITVPQRAFSWNKLLLWFKFHRNVLLESQMIFRCHWLWLFRERKLLHLIKMSLKFKYYDYPALSQYREMKPNSVHAALKM